MKHIRKLFCILALCAVLLTGCTSYMLTDQLPTLMNQDTQMPEITSIDVVRLSDNAVVTLESIDKLTEMINHITGIQCIRTRQPIASYAEQYPLQYEIIFRTANGSTELYVSASTEFYLENYSYSALSGGIDFFYLDYMFADIDEARG